MKKRKDKSELNANELLFCARYVEMGQNGTQAYMSVYPRSGAEAAATSAYRLLRNPQIVAEVKRLIDASLQAEVLSATQVLTELSRLSAYDIGEITDSNGRMLPLRQMPERVRRAIKSIKRDSRGNVEVTFHDKTPALNIMAKHHKLASDNVNIKGKFTLEDLVAGDPGDQ